MTTRFDPWGRDSRKQSIYVPREVLDEIRQEAERQDRSLSWLVQQAWKVARDRIRALPSNPIAKEQTR